jgi:hypothetical protein
VKTQPDVWAWTVGLFRRVFRFLMLDHLGRWNHYDIIVVALFVCMTKIHLDVMGELTFEVYAYTLKGRWTPHGR